jgi:GDPmannose 4,6-dehydratase
LGNLEARRDWGFTGDYVKAMWLMLQQPTPDDYIVATGEAPSVREFVELAFAAARPRLAALRGDRSPLFPPNRSRCAARRCCESGKVLDWEPGVDFAELVKMMVEHDIELARRERTVNQAGFAASTRGAAVAGS